MTHHDIDRRSALCELLALPTPAEWTGGAIVECYDGDPARFERWRWLPVVFANRRRVEREERVN